MNGLGAYSDGIGMQNPEPSLSDASEMLEASLKKMNAASLRCSESGANPEVLAFRASVVREEAANVVSAAYVYERAAYSAAKKAP